MMALLIVEQFNISHTVMALGDHVAVVTVGRARSSETSCFIQTMSITSAIMQLEAFI